MVVASGKYLEEHKSFVDSLNVFPVPDGDTGTNMSLTMASAAKSAQQQTEARIDEAAKTVSYGALMGARGNSGVILSQLFAGFAKGTEGKEILDKADLAACLAGAVSTAYQAVMNPVEGTILTVSRESAEAAASAARAKDATLVSVMEAALQGALLSLEKTPNLLPVLKQAGVVDAGGQGYVYIIEGMLKVLKGEEPTYINDKENPREEVRSAVSYFEEGSLEFQYCTEFVLKAKQGPLDLEAIRAFLTDKGDCLLVVGSPAAAKIHIHTNHPGVVLEYCTNAGTLHEVQINNMAEQSKEFELKGKAPKHVGIVSVAVGSGLIEIFKSLGVDAVITGGQTMNPSTQDFVEAIDNIFAEEVLILPNNGNVLLAARQAVAISGKPAQVVETRTVPQGIAALMAYNASNDMHYNREKMEEASKNVKTLEVTYAIRDSEFDGHKIEKDQILGLADDKLVVTGDTPAGVVEQLLAGQLTDVYELVTVYFGQDVGEEEARSLVEKLSAQYGEVDFELHQGGQPLYYYLISLE
jgi:DAK2 domain fusion protein YloV